MRFVVISLILLLIFCEKKDVQTIQNDAAQTSTEVLVEKIAVCIWDQGAVREDANKKAKWLSSMALGEIVSYLGESKKDSSDNNTLYHKIKLSDEKIGWVSDYVIEIDAKPAVIINDISLYRRPDLLTVTDQKLSRIEVVAIKNSENEWSEIVASEKKKKGWIQNAQVSLKAEDIAVAVLYSKAMKEKDPIKQKEKLKELATNSAFQSSYFIGQIKSMIESDVEEIEEDSTESNN